MELETSLIILIIIQVRCWSSKTEFHLLPGIADFVKLLICYLILTQAGLLAYLLPWRHCWAREFSEVDSFRDRMYKMCRQPLFAGTFSSNVDSSSLETDECPGSRTSSSWFLAPESISMQVIDSWSSNQVKSIKPHPASPEWSLFLKMFLVCVSWHPEWSRCDPPDGTSFGHHDHWLCDELL